MKNRFYLACFRDNVGANVGFHAIDGKGYVTDIDKAHQYTLEQAQRAWDCGREFDQPISADHIDSQTVWKVDCQYIPHLSFADPKYQEYVAFQKGRWNGNDVFWITESGMPTVDFSKAKRFSLDIAKGYAYDEELVYVPFERADKVKRRTFDYSKFNARTMVQGAGLKMPDWLKRKKRRSNNPKVRWNCPCCGKINWQLNPYDFDGCSDITCDEYRGIQNYFVA